MVRKYKDLSAEEIYGVLQLHEKGSKRGDVATQFDISKSTVGTIVKNHSGSDIETIVAVVERWHEYRRFWLTLFFEKREQHGPMPPIPFAMEDIKDVIHRLNLNSNPYDLKYNSKSRGDFPEAMRAAAAAGKEWRVTTLAKGKYAFTLHDEGEGIIEPDTALPRIKIYDALPSIVERYARKDEQALLARIRYNNLVGVFLGLSVYSLQSHWKTSIRGAGIPIEIDEMYVGMDANGCQFVIPVEAKSVGPRENVTASQVLESYRAAQLQFPAAEIVPVAAKVLDDYSIAMWRLEVDVQTGTVKPVFERHYELSRNPAAGSPQPTLLQDEAAKYRPVRLPGEDNF